MKRYTLPTITGILLAVFMLPSLAMAATSTSSTTNISKSYDASTTIADGTMVSLVPGKTNAVEPATSKNIARLIGVAVDDKQSLLAVNSGSGKVQVATSGVTNVFVSTINGDIKVGDPISASPISGVGMKLSSGRILGIAQSPLNAKTPGARKEAVPDSKTDVYVSQIKLNIAVGSNNAGGTSLNKLQQIVRSITGKTIPTIRIVIAIVVASVALIAIIVLIYSSIYGALISIGRNPLARNAVIKALTFVIIMVTAIAVVSTILVLALLS